MGRNFYRLGTLFQEVAQYLDEKKETIEQELVHGPFGSYLMHPSRFPSLEVRYFLEEKARASHAHLSQDSCEILLRLISINAPKAKIHAGPLTYILNKDYLFLLNEEMPRFDWQMMLLDDLTPVLRKKMKKWYAKHKVPAFFHDKAPVFMKGGELVTECLTGKSLSVSSLKN